MYVVNYFYYTKRGLEEMAVPKRKVSKSVKRTRREANFKAHPNTIIECPQCHASVTPHTVCKACGYYKGSKVIETKQEKNQAKKEA